MADAQDLLHVRGDVGRGHRALLEAAAAGRDHPGGVPGHVVDRVLEGGALEGDAVPDRDLLLRSERPRIEGRAFERLGVDRPRRGGIGESALRPGLERRCEGARDEPHPAQVPLHGGGRVGLLPDEGPAALRIVPAAVDGLRDHVRRGQRVGAPEVELADAEVIGDDDDVVVRDAAGHPDRAGFAAFGGPFRPDAADLHRPELARIGDAEGLGATAGGQETVLLDERADELYGLAGGRASLEGEDLGLFDRHDLARQTVDPGDVELGALRAGAFADGQLALVHLRVAGVEIGERALDLGNVADDPAELA